MATLADLIERSRIAARDRPRYDSLNGSISNVATSITLTSGTKIADKEGQPVINIDFEELLVIDKPTITTATVVRAWNGTTAAAHADKATVLVGYRHSRDEYRRAVQRALDAISFAFGKKLWDETQSFSSTSKVIKVPSTTLRVNDLFDIPSAITKLKRVPFSFERSLPTSIASTGKGLKLTGWHPREGTAYIGYETAWPLPTNDADAIDSAFPVDGEDLIEAGALAYLSDKEAFMRITFTEAHTRLLEQAAQEGSVRAEARDKLARFLIRRQELGVRERRKNVAWMRGL